MWRRSRPAPAPTVRRTGRRPATARTPSRPRPSWPRSPSPSPRPRTPRTYRGRVTSSPTRWWSPTPASSRPPTRRSPIRSRPRSSPTGAGPPRPPVPVTTATPASAATGFPTGAVLVIAPLGTVTFTIIAHVAVPYNGTTVTNTATATPGLNTICEDGRPDLPGRRQLRQPGPAGRDQDPHAHRSGSARGSASHLHGDHHQPGYRRHRIGLVLRSAPAANSTRRRHLDLHPDRRHLDVRDARRHGLARPGWPSRWPPTAAPWSSPSPPPSWRAVPRSRSTMSASVTPNPGTTCTDGQATCDGEDTFTADATPATLTIAKTHAPRRPDPGPVVYLHRHRHQHQHQHGGPGNSQRPVRLVGTDRDHLDGHRFHGGSSVTPPSGSVSITGGAGHSPARRRGHLHRARHRPRRLARRGRRKHLRGRRPATNTKCDPSCRSVVLGHG